MLVEFAIFILVAPMYLLSLFGVGLFFHKIIRVNPISYSLTVAVGVVVFIIYGGILSATSQTAVVTLYAPLVLGLLFAVYSALPLRAIAPLHWPRPAAWLGMTLIALLFTVHSIPNLAPSNFNHHDDLANYIAHPVVMLQTGSAYFGETGPINIHTLGGMSVIHGVLCAVWPLKYINAADVIFGLLLCILLIAETCLRIGVRGAISIVPVLLIIFIPPQYVNISSLYFGSYLLSLLIIIPVSYTLMNRIDEVENLSTAGLLGAICGCLIVLKLTFVVPAFFVMVSIVVFVAIVTRSIIRTVLWTFASLSGSLLAILPWAVPHTEQIQRTFAQLSGDNGSGVAEQGRVDFSFLASPNPLFYGRGSSILDHHILIGTALVISLLLLWNVFGKRQSGDASVRQPAVLVSLLCIAVVSFWCVGMYLIGIGFLAEDMGSRYLAPGLIGLLPAVVVAALALGKRGLLPAATVAAIGSVIVLGAFLSPTVDRLEQLYSKGSMLSYPAANRTRFSKRMRDYTTFALGGEADEMMRDIQGMVPEGTQVLALVALPHLLDYRRNSVTLVVGHGLGRTLTELDLSAGAQGLRDFLNKKGIDYIVWQKKGLGILSRAQQEARIAQNNIRSGNARRALMMIEALREIANEDEAIMRTEQFEVLKFSRKN